MRLETLTLRVFHSRLMRLFNDRLFLQFRPTFCRADNPKVGTKFLYDVLREDWKVNDRRDIIRYYFIYLQLERIEHQQVAGDIAELGVYNGNTALFINRVSPHRRLHLFDTFSGFSEKDAKQFAASHTFRDVSLSLSLSL
jgi:Macrocin-O-methyltransferase (TylF)